MRKESVKKQIMQLKRYHRNDRIRSVGCGESTLCETMKKYIETHDVSESIIMHDSEDYEPETSERV